MAHTKLTAKQDAFWQAYCTNGGNASAAYRAAYKALGMKEATVNRAAHDLITNPKIAARIAEVKKSAFDTTHLTVQRIIEEYMRAAFLDPAKLFASDGSLLPIDQMDEDTRRAIVGIDIVEQAGGGKGDDARSGATLKKIKLADKLAALNDLGRYMGIFIEKKELTGKDGAPLQQLSGVLLLPGVLTEDEWEKLAGQGDGHS